MEELQPFIRVQSNPAIVPVGDLPKKYRKAITRGVSTGWMCVDKFLQGIRPGEVTVVTADTGCGKTTFCTQLMVNIAMQNVPVWICSWEMRPESMLRKVASIVLRRPMKLEEFSDRDSDQFDEWCKKYLVFMNPQTVGCDLETLSKDLKIAAGHGIKVVMLDHLDYLVKNTKEKLHEAIDETVKRLHELAFDTGLHILLIVHPRQISTATEEVGIHSLKGSSSIKQYADNVIVLHRSSRTDANAAQGKVKVKVAKNRMFGTEGNTYLFYQQDWDGYLELKDGI